MQLPLVIVLALVESIATFDDQFNEELYVRQLPTGHVYSVFQFTTHVDQNIFLDKMTSHFNLFPKSFGEIVSAFSIAELRLTLTQGRWLYNKWSYPVHSAPTGIELAIWFDPNLNRSTVDEKWRGVVHALSGQFCTSLNFITKELTAVPALSWKPMGLWNAGHASPNDHLRYASLPRETVCTENLTPWKKLLPCGDHAGFATLLRSSSKLFDSSYVSLGITLRSVCPPPGEDMEQVAGNECVQGVQLQLKQTISVVSDGYKELEYTKWSLGNLFGSKLHSTCPVASTSNLLLDFNDGSVSKLKLEPPFHRLVGSDSEMKQRLHLYDIKAVNFTTTKHFDIEVSVDFHKLTRVTETRPYIFLQKFTSGYGMEMGGIVCLISNTHPRDKIRVVYFDVFPYYVNVYFHTLTITVGNIPVTPEKLLFTPGYRGERPASVEFVLMIPAASTARVTVQFDKVFLDWMQYKPDAHHGFYLGSSVVTAYIPRSNNATMIAEHCLFLSKGHSCLRGLDSSGRILRRVFSTSLLIRVALPDFSMPYNVLCLTCTVIAIAFGSIYNLSTKTFHLEPVTKKRKALKERWLSFKDKIIGTLFGATRSIRMEAVEDR